MDTPRREGRRAAGHDIAVVVQGAWAPGHTERTLASVRATLPGARIVLSTWAGTAPSHARDLADAVVENDDPGATVFGGCPDASALAAHGMANANLHSQNVSTRNGLAAVDRPLALKIRTDMTLDHQGFLDWWLALRDRPCPGLVLRDRLVTTSARHPARSLCYYVQDFVQFGRTDDMIAFWDAPPPPDGERLAAMGAARAAASLLQAEQYLVVSLLERSGAPGYVRLERHSAAPPEAIIASETLVASNFACLDTDAFGVSFLKPSVAWIDDGNPDMFSHGRIAKATMTEWAEWVVTRCGDDLSDLPAWALVALSSSRAESAWRQGEALAWPIRDSDATSGFLLAAAADWALRRGDVEEAGEAVRLLAEAGCRDPILHALRSRLDAVPTALAP